MQLQSQEKDPVRTTGAGLLKGNIFKSNVHLQGDAKPALITWNDFRKLKQSASGWENFQFSSVVTKSMKMRLSGFSGLGLLNMTPPQEQALLVFAAASSCSPTLRQTCLFLSAMPGTNPSSSPRSSPEAVIPKWALSMQK